LISTDPLFGDLLYDIHELAHTPVSDGSEYPRRARDLSPTCENRSPGDVLVINRNLDAPLQPSLLKHLLEVPKLVPVAEDPSPRRKRGYPLLKKSQVGEHKAVRALHLRGELKRDVLCGSAEADVVDDEVMVGRFS